MPPIEGKRYLLVWLAVPLIVALAYHLFLENPSVLAFLNTALTILVLFFSVVIHEMSHGIGAGICGDPTAELSGRLTFNPVSHVSLVGTIVVPLVLYFVSPSMILGWAKPVPFNPANLRRYPRDQVFLTLAGPLSNFALAVIFFIAYLAAALIYNRFTSGPHVGFFLDIRMDRPFAGLPWEAVSFVVFKSLTMGLIINLVLGVFNLIPIPPLDGHWLLRAILPSKMSQALGRIGPFGILILVLAIQLDLLHYFFYPVSLVLYLFGAIATAVLG